MKSGIYALIENRLGHRFYGMPRYIGQSVNLPKRKLFHFKVFKSNSHHNKYLQRIQNNHFEKGVSLGWVPIIYCHEKDLNYYERELIKLYKNSITNISDGGVDQDIKAAAKLGGLTTGKKNMVKLNQVMSEDVAQAARVKGGKIAMSKMSRESKVKSGKISGSLTYKLGIGIHKQTIEERRERGLLHVKLKKGIHGLSKEEKTITSRKTGELTYQLRVGIHKQTIEERRERGLKHKNLKMGIHGLTEEQKVINSMKGVEAKQKISQERLEQQLLSAGFNKHYRPTLSEAKQHTISYCWGRVCDKHPELEGKRKTSNNGCTGCETDRKRRIRTTNKDLGPKTAPNLKRNNLTLDQL